MPPRQDFNTKIAALLRDLADVQESPQSAHGYRRAARAVLELDQPIDRFLKANGSLEKIPNIGPKSAAVALEVIETGTSEIVARAIADSGKRVDGDEQRALRKNFLSRAQVLAALRNRKLTGPSLADYRGDFQMHSTWSDGSQTFEDIVEACLARGYTHAAVTDHSHGLRIARGLSMADLARQQQEIDRINRRYRGRFRIIKGIEANILADGTLDMSLSELDKVELVVAAPHSALRSERDQTARMVGAVTTPGVHILGHPRGRKYGERAGIVADWDVVFAAAAGAGVAVEIDGDPSRQDIDHTLAKRALDAGCLFALDSDAHAVDELVAAETAIAHARLAGVPPDRVINRWALDRLLDWLAR